MKLKLYSPISYQGADGNELTTEYVYIRKPTIGDLVKRENIGILSSIINKAQKFLYLGSKVLSSDKTKEQMLQEVEESGVDLDKEEDAISNAEGYISACVFGGYEDIIDDLLKKGPAYFDRFLYVDENMTKNISPALIKQQLSNNGDILDLYKIMFYFFFQATNTSRTRKIEM